MNKIMIADVKKITAVFIAMIIAVLSLSYTGNRAEALNTSRKYYVYNAKTGNKKSEYTLNPVSSINNSRSVIGEDERVIDWTKSGVVKLITDKGLGSGFVVSDHVIATAAHCVDNQKISEILLFDNNGNVTLHATPVDYHIPYEYIRANDETYDYALITVKEDLSSYACFDLGVPLKSFANKKTAVTVTGFSADKKASDGNYTNTSTMHMMYSANGIVNKIDDSDLMFYTADTAGGNSGGPVYITESYDGRTYYTVVAIHAYRPHDDGIDHSAGNHGTCITTDLIHFYTANNTNINW